jgi:AcrR family transcriptional regulator
MSSTTTEDAIARGRGRPREFDADDVLDRVVELFCEQGFEATSMADLVEATGLNKSSIYNTFGSKDELFHTAVDRYVHLRTTMLHSVLRDGSSGLDDVRTMIGLARDEACGQLGWRGCMAVNTSTELGIRDDVATELSTRFRNEVRDSFGAALRRAADAGEIDHTAVDRYTETLLSFVLSLSVFTRGGAHADELDRQFAAIIDTIDSWDTTGRSSPDPSG